MTTTYSHADMESQPPFDLKAFLAEPFLIVGSLIFWIITLPVAAVAVFSVKIWDTVSGRSQQIANPLILRRGSVAGSDPSLTQRHSPRRA